MPTIGAAAVACFEKYRQGPTSGASEFRGLPLLRVRQSRRRAASVQGRGFRARQTSNNWTDELHEEAAATMTPQPAPPIGPLVDAHPAKRPERVTLERPMDHARAARRREARRGALSRAPTATRHATASGPICSTAPIRDPPPSRPASPPRRSQTDPLFFAILDNATGARGRLSDALCASTPPNRVIEVGNIMYTPAMQRTAGRDRGAISLRPIRLRRTRLPPLRMEMQRPQRALEARGGTLRLHLRRNLPPAHDRQGPQSRHRLVRNARQRMAGAQGGL